MKTVLVENGDGRKHPVYLPDSIPNHQADAGIPAMSINLDDLDWDGIKVEIHNRLVEHGLYTEADLSTKPDVLQQVILSVMRRKLILLYRTANSPKN